MIPALSTFRSLLAPFQFIRAPAGCHVERTTRCGVRYRCGPLEQYDNTNMTCDIWTMPPSRCGGVERVLRSTSDSVRGLPSAAIICHHLTVPTQLRRGGKQDYVPCPRPNTGHYTDTGPLLLQWLSRGTCWLLGRIGLVDAGLVSNYLLFQIIFTAGCAAHYITA